ncbi:MAG: hypothetical protein S4CHLAM81_07300 [Chlamydiales bacterium]|nr:hypothetical protein [Chlamydiales bacterium]MCH9635514.1 hypothetical protein [Chlamydiales bacterium]
MVGMAESWNVDPAAHDFYAQGVRQLQEFEQTLKPPKDSGTVAHHTTVLQLQPEVPHVVRLMRQDHRKSWADFAYPTNYFSWRYQSSYFLGSNDKIAADRERVIAHNEQNQGYGDSHEGETIANFLTKVTNYNDLVSDVMARIKQFLQG